MNVEHELQDIPCGCDPYSTQAEIESCGPCKPNQALTCEEETILAKMREVKVQARAVADRMKQIGPLAREGRSEGSANGEEAEWRELFHQLDELRNQWSQWQGRLEEAIERKLILLGHRER